MATIGQIADAIKRYLETHEDLENIMDPVVIEVEACDLAAGNEETVFVTSRLSTGPWPSAEVVLDLTDGETRSDIMEAAEASEGLENLLRVWNIS